MKFSFKSFLLLLFFLSFYGCMTTRPLPKTLDENRIIMIANYKWIGKIGKKTISEGPATPVLKNVDTGKKYKPDYYDRNYTYFSNLEKGNYLVEEIILDAGQAKLHIKTIDKTRVFEINELGAYYIGGVDIIDTQFKIEYKVHDGIQNEQNLEKIRNILIMRTSFSPNIEVHLIKDVHIKERW